MFWKKNKPRAPADEESCANALFHALAESLKTDGRIRAEDIITAAASITGELCIEAAGDFSPRNQRFGPGSRVFSEKVNELFSGNSTNHDIEAVPTQNILGIPK